MNTKILMIATVLYLGIVGIGLTFLPQEIAGLFVTETNDTLILSFQILGAQYLGFAMINWMSKEGLIGGIYKRPIVIGNFMHFLISALALSKVVGKYAENQFVPLLIITILYSIFAVCFGYLLKSSPVKPEDIA